MMNKFLIIGLSSFTFINWCFAHGNLPGNAVDYTCDTSKVRCVAVGGAGSFHAPYEAYYSDDGMETWTTAKRIPPNTYGGMLLSVSCGFDMNHCVTVGYDVQQSMGNIIGPTLTTSHDAGRNWGGAAEKVKNLKIKQSVSCSILDYKKSYELVKCDYLGKHCLVLGSCVADINLNRNSMLINTSTFGQDWNDATPPYPEGAVGMTLNNLKYDPICRFTTVSGIARYADGHTMSVNYKSNDGGDHWEVVKIKSPFLIPKNQ